MGMKWGDKPFATGSISINKVKFTTRCWFYREVGEQSAIYWKKDELSQVIEEVEQFDEKMIDELDRQSNQRIADAFTWERIVTDYENLFKNENITLYFRISTPANRWLG